MDRLQRADSLPLGGWASCNLLRAWTKQKGRGIKSTSVWALGLHTGLLRPSDSDGTYTTCSSGSPETLQPPKSPEPIPHNTSLILICLVCFILIYLSTIGSAFLVNSNTYYNFKWVTQHPMFSVLLLKTLSPLLFLIITNQSKNIIRHLKYELSRPKHPVFTISQLHYIVFCFTI